LSSRRVCKSCGTNFQVGDLDDEKKCMECGGELIQREDDKAESIEKRYELFEMQLEIIQHYFKKRDRYYEVDGMKTKPERLEEFLKAIEK
jgi:adenylate kinase